MIPQQLQGLDELSTYLFTGFPQVFGPLLEILQGAAFSGLHTDKVTEYGRRVSLWISCFLLGDFLGKSASSFVDV